MFTNEMMNLESRGENESVSGQLLLEPVRSPRVLAVPSSFIMETTPTLLPPCLEGAHPSRLTWGRTDDMDVGLCLHQGLCLHHRLSTLWRLDLGARIESS